MSAGRTIIHIGHSKTGTSAIQSFLALNAELLGDFGVDYPWHQSFEHARQGKITSGNLHSFFAAEASRAATRLFSSEAFFAQLREGTEFFDKLSSLRGAVTLICYTRDLFDHFSSAYGQYVKRGGGTKSAEEFVGHYNIYVHLSSILDLADRLEIEIRLHNYSRLREPVEDSFARLVLGDEADLFLPRSKRVQTPVNRSLTRGELELQRFFNVHARAQTSPFVSDALVNDLPDIPGERISFTPSMCDRLIGKNIAAIEKINTRMPEGHAIGFDKPSHASTGADDPAFAFSADQLEVLARNISDRINALQPSAREIDTLRDVALKFETGQPLNRQEALILMKLALRARPHGPLIQQKVKAWDQDASE